MAKVKAALLEKVGAPLVIDEVELDSPREGEVLVQVRASGLCHSDLSYIDHDYGFRLPIVLGHEVAGVVAEVGPGVRSLAPGDHVVTCLSGHCGLCTMCVQGKTWLCTEQHRVLGRSKGMPTRISRGGARVTQSAHIGGLAERVLVSELATVRVRSDLPLDRAALLGCSVVTGVGAATKAACIHAGDKVVVVGCGAVGLNIVQGARLAGAGFVVAVDVDDAKLGLAVQFGADAVVDAQAGDAVAAVRELTGGGADHAFEVVGVAKTAAQATKMAAKGGSVYLVGQPTPQVEYAFNAFDLVTSAKSVQGVLMGATQFRLDIPRYADLYGRGRIKLDELVGQHVRLEDVNKAFQAMRDRTSVGRTVVVFD